MDLYLVATHYDRMSSTMIPYDTVQPLKSVPQQFGGYPSSLAATTRLLALSSGGAVLY
jgi:hypothetical protein